MDIIRAAFLRHEGCRLQRYVELAVIRGTLFVYLARVRAFIAKAIAYPPHVVLSFVPLQVARIQTLQNQI